MTGTAYTPLPDGATADDVWRAVNQLIHDANGSTSWQRKKNWVGTTDNSSYVVTLTNNGTGGHLTVPNEMQVKSDGSGTTIRTLAVTGAFSAGATTLASLHVTGNSVLDGTLGAGATTVTTLHATGAATLDSTLGAGATTLASLSVTGDAAVLGNTALGNANADTLTVIAVSTFRNAAAAVQLFIDAANNRVLVGTATALGTAANDLFSVVGGTSYFVGASGAAIGIRYVSTDTVGWLVSKDGAGADKDLLFLDDGGLEIVRIGDTASTYQLKVTGALLVSGVARRISGDFSNATHASRLAFQTSTAASSSVVSAIPSSGGTTAGYAAYADPAMAAGAFVQMLAVGTTDVRLNSSKLSGTALPLKLMYDGTTRIEIDTTGLGFFAQAPVARPTVTGSRAANAALASALSALANLGLVTDNSTV